VSHTPDQHLGIYSRHTQEPGLLQPWYVSSLGPRFSERVSLTPPQATKDTPSATTTSGNITDWVKPGDTSGEFKRQQSSFRNWISREAGAQFPPEKGRYHLYVSYACPWVSTAVQSSLGLLRGAQ
jgi:hypothetical protein